MIRLPHSLARALLPPDTRERHAVVARFAKGATEILDVGGVSRHLEAFVHGTRVVTANLEPPADMILNGTELPLPTASYDIVTSLDVLEHIPSPARAGYVAELARVARRRVILCCPVGTEAHVACEAALADWYRAETGRSHRFLQEHIELGLPREEELRRFFEEVGLRFRVSFHGDFREIADVFRLQTHARLQPNPGSFARLVRRRCAPRRTFDLVSAVQPFSNRAVVVADHELAHVASRQSS